MTLEEVKLILICLVVCIVCLRLLRLLASFKAYGKHEAVRRHPSPDQAKAWRYDVGWGSRQ